MPTDKGTREAIRAFEEKMRIEGADGFAAGPHPWEDWDVSGNTESNDRIWDNSALHEGGRKRTRSGPGERLLNGLAMLALLALLVGIGGVYFSEEPELTIAQQGVQPLPIIRNKPPAAAPAPIHRTPVRPMPLAEENQDVSAPLAGSVADTAGISTEPPAPENAPSTAVDMEAPAEASASVTPTLAVPAPGASPVAPVPASPLGAQTDANIAMGNAGEPPVIGAPSSAVTDVPAEDASDIAEPETPQAAEAIPVPLTADGMPLSAASSILDEAPDTAEPEAQQVPEAIPVAPTADGMPLSAASSVPDEAPGTAEPEATRAPAATPAPASTRPPEPEPETATAPATEQVITAVTETTLPAAATASPPVEAATQPPTPPSATPAPDETVSVLPSDDATAAADHAATREPAPVAPEPDAPARQPAVARNPNAAALMPDDVSGGWAVNLVSYTHETAARRILKEYRDEGIVAEIQMVILNDKPMYRVRIVGYESRPAAQAQIEPLQKLLDLDSVWVSRK